MVNKCKIVRRNINSAPNEVELMVFAEREIVPFLEEIFDTDAYYTDDKLNPTKSKLATIALIQGLGESYAISEYKYIVKAIELLLNQPEYKFLTSIMPRKNLLTLLKAKGTAEEISANVFTDTIESDDSTEYDSVNYFLNNAYKQAILAKTKLERKMNNIVLNSFIINRDEGYVVSDITTALTKVENYKKELFKDIQ
jgi:hypothetical protein